MVARNPLQETEGRKAKPGYTWGDFALVESKATVVAALATFGRGDFLWAGLGPSVNRLELQDELSAQTSKATTVGLVAEAGVRWPPASLAFFELRGQYRWAAWADMSLFAYAPSAHVSGSHAAVTVGVGFRLGGRVGAPAD